MAELDAYPAALGPAAREQAILMTHGRYDGLLPIDLVREQAQALKALGLDLAWAEYDKDHTLDPEDEVADIRSWMERRMRPSAKG